MIVNEAHLTIMASGYWEAMVQLGWCVRQIKVQNVWLTATLPPSMQDEFLKQNKLVQLQIVRESTNHQNIKYIISVESQNLLKSAVDLIRTYWPTHILDHD